jgi:starch phosphorylase
MVGQYVSKFYLGAAQRGRRYSELQFEAAKAVSQWKAQTRAAWPGVSLRRTDRPEDELVFGRSMRVELAIQLNGLKPDDVIVELLLAGPEHDVAARKSQHHPFIADGTVTEAGEHRYVLELTPDFCGRLDYRIRMYPWHRLLAHPFELGLMLWS